MAGCSRKRHVVTRGGRLSVKGLLAHLTITLRNHDGGGQWCNALGCAGANLAILSGKRRRLPACRKPLDVYAGPQRVCISVSSW